MNLVQDGQFALHGQAVEHVGDFAQLPEVELAKVLPVLLLDERVCVGKQDLVEVEGVRSQELLESLLVHFVFVREEHLRRQFLLLHFIGLHFLNLVLDYIPLLHGLVHLRLELKLLRCCIRNRETPCSLFNDFWLHTVYLINELLHVLKTGPFVVLVIVIQTFVKHCNQLVLINMTEYFRLLSLFVIGDSPALSLRLTVHKSLFIFSDAFLRVYSTWMPRLSQEGRRHAHT